MISIKYSANHNSTFSDFAWMMCDPCHNHWDGIVKMETFDRDAAAILKAATGGEIKLKHLNDHSKASGGDFDKSFLLQLFGNTSKETLGGILDAYSKDFLMCGYNQTLYELKELVAEKNTVSM